MQPSVKRKHRQQTVRRMIDNRALYLMILPAFLYILIFHYWPMYGVQIAFRNFNFADGITGSKWVGMKWFSYFFRSNNFGLLVRNTLILSFYDLLAGFPVPILLALIMNAVPSRRFRKVSQTITYLPHFISVIVLVGMMNSMFSVNSGWVSTIVRALGGTPTYIMGEAKYFRHVYVWSGVWQQMGWNSIIYLAALTSIDPSLYEAATVDGANKWQQFTNITIPQLRPTTFFASIMMIISCFKIFDVVAIMTEGGPGRSTKMLVYYIYDVAFMQNKYGLASAISMVLLVIVLIITVIQFRSEKKFAND